MIKIILLGIAFWLLISILKAYRKSLDNVSNTPAQPKEAEPMVQCAHCGVHLPESESLLVDQQYFCCQAHADENSKDATRDR